MRSDSIFNFQCSILTIRHFCVPNVFKMAYLGEKLNGIVKFYVDLFGAKK